MTAERVLIALAVVNLVVLGLELATQLLAGLPWPR
jgi:hypothetical protein